MSKKLIVCATLFELADFFEHYLTLSERETLAPILSNPRYTGLFNIREELDCCITGVGVPSCLINLTRLPLHSYSFVLGVGFVGSYRNLLQIGEVVQITEDAFADLGIVQDAQFVPLNATPFPVEGKENEPFYVASNLFMANYRMCRAFTRNMPTGELTHVAGLDWQEAHVEVESMEGAAFAMVCEQSAQDYLSLRVVSNYVRPGAEAQWNAALAQKYLAAAMFEALKARQQ